MVAGMAIRRCLAAALAYAATVFTAGFVLGILRTVWIQPAIGAFAAVLVELPFMILWSWLVCRRMLASFAVPPHAGSRLGMGLASLALLLTAELLLSMLLGGGGLQAFLAGLVRPEGLAGLCGQLLFALMPLILIRERR